MDAVVYVTEQRMTTHAHLGTRCLNMAYMFCFSNVAHYLILQETDVPRGNKNKARNFLHINNHSDHK